MPVSFFITNHGELYADMGVKLDSDEIFAWLSQNGIDLGRKSSFTVTKESPIFKTLEEAESWVRDTFSDEEDLDDTDDELFGNPSEWGKEYVGKKIAEDRLAEPSAGWTYVGSEGRFLFGYNIKEEGYINIFPPTQSPCHLDVTLAIFVQTNEKVISGIKEFSVIRSNWGDYQELGTPLFPPDIQHARGLVESILSET